MKYSSSYSSIDWNKQTKFKIRQTIVTKGISHTGRYYFCQQKKKPVHTYVGLTTSQCVHNTKLKRQIIRSKCSSCAISTAILTYVLWCWLRIEFESSSFVAWCAHTVKISLSFELKSKWEEVSKKSILEWFKHQSNTSCIIFSTRSTSKVAHTSSLTKWDVPIFHKNHISTFDRFYLKRMTKTE